MPWFYCDFHSKLRTTVSRVSPYCLKREVGTPIFVYSADEGKNQPWVLSTTQDDKIQGVMEVLTQGSTILQLERLKSWNRWESNSRPHAREARTLIKELASQALAIHCEEICIRVFIFRIFWILTCRNRMNNIDCLFLRLIRQLLVVVKI